MGVIPTARIFFAGVCYVLQSKQAPSCLGQQGRLLNTWGVMAAWLWMLNRLCLLQPASKWRRHGTNLLTGIGITCARGFLKRDRTVVALQCT